MTYCFRKFHILISLLFQILLNSVKGSVWITSMTDTHLIFRVWVDRFCPQKVTKIHGKSILLKEAVEEMTKGRIPV